MVTVEISVLLLLCLTSTAKGAFFQPSAYTLPDGLQSVNGSSSTGGCQPESCVMMPISGSSINGCDCPINAPVSGVLIDGVIPSIDTTQQRLWARELFVVNRNGQDSFMIGFEFSDTVPLAYVEIVHLDCPIWGIGTSAVNVYSSNLFPTFVTDASVNIGQLSLAEDTDQSCTSLKTISIPLQQISLEFCFIEFTFGGSSTRPILYLAEIRFSDIDLVPTTGSITSQSLLVSTIPTTLPESTAPTNLPVSTILENLDSTTGDVITVMLNATEPSSNNTTVSANTDMPPVRNAAIPVPVFVGTLVGVIAFLTLLAVTVVIIIRSCVYVKWKQSQGRSADHGYDYVTEMGRGNSRATNPIEVKANEAYGTHQQDNNTILETPSDSVDAQYEELPC